MAVLILLNGPPASGKSTIAQRFVDNQQLALNLDIDIVRGLLGDWLTEPTAAGLMARSLALTMAETHLASGHTVIVPQFLGRPGFIGQLEDLADRSGAPFIETALWMDRASAVAAFAERRITPQTQAHVDAAALVDRSDQPDPVGQMYDAFVKTIMQRPATRRVDVVARDIEQTFTNFMQAVGIVAEQRP